LLPKFHIPIYCYRKIKDLAGSFVYLTTIKIEELFL